MTDFAFWLDTAFSGFDESLLGFCHGFAEKAGGFFTPFCNFVSAFGHKGIAMIICCVILLLFKKTRKVGVVASLSMIFGALLVNVSIKPLVMRGRPYTVTKYKEWWALVGSPMEKDFSFPSGHVNCVTAVLFGVFLASINKKKTFPVLLFPIIMCFARNYLMVHYPTDVIAGLATGSLSAVASYIIVNLAYRKMEKTNGKFYAFLSSASIVNLFVKKKPDFGVAHDADGVADGMDGVADGADKEPEMADEKTHGTEKKNEVENEK